MLCHKQYEIQAIKKSIVFNKLLIDLVPQEETGSVSRGDKGET